MEMPKLDSPQGNQDQKKGWQVGQIENPGMPSGGRGLKSYENVLGFQKEDLEGLRVLDLGTGPKIKFSKELKDAGISADVVSLSPDFMIEEHRKTAKEADGESDLVAGIGQELPFDDESFDRVMCLNVAEHLPNKKALVDVVIEIARVLKKKSGVGYIGPFETVLNKKNSLSGEGADECYEFLANSKRLADYRKKNRIKIWQEELPGTANRTGFDKKTGRSFRAPMNRIIIEKGE